MSSGLNRRHQSGWLCLSGGTGFGPVWRAWLLCGLVSLIVAACGHQDLVAIKPAGTGGAPSCAGDRCSYTDANHYGQCCDGTRCNGTTCVPWDAGYCSNFGQACSNDGFCCGGSPCESVAQSAKLCVGYSCQRVNTGCSIDADCCSFSCQDGICSDGQPCTIQGKSCAVDEDCCSRHCANKTCDNSTGTCAVIGDSCKTSDACCSKTCVDVGNGSRCLSGGLNTCGGLAPDGESCSQSYECCSKTCYFGRCLPACATRPGSACSDPADCCSGKCLFDGTSNIGACAPN
jgi:hypothetical protein